MVSVEDGSLNGRRLNHVLGHMSRPKTRTVSLRTKLGLHVNA